MFSRDLLKHWREWTRSSDHRSWQTFCIFVVVLVFHAGLVKVSEWLPAAELKQSAPPAPIVLHDPKELKDQLSQQQLVRPQTNSNLKRPTAPNSKLSTKDHQALKENIPKGEMKEVGGKQLPKDQKPEVAKNTPPPTAEEQHQRAADIGPQILSPRLENFLPRSSLNYSNSQKKLGSLSMQGSGQATAQGDPESEKNGPIDINTHEYKYAHYFDTMMRQIEEVWRYPEEAWRAGMQGRAVFDIMIDRQGKLKRLALVKSSGYSVLDYEIQRAVYSASPFNPVPTRIEQDPLVVRVTFTYTLTRYGIF